MSRYTPSGPGPSLGRRGAASLLLRLAAAPALGVGCRLAPPGGGPEPAATAPRRGRGAVTGLAALASVLPRLAELHPLGTVEQLYSLDEPPDGPPDAPGSTTVWSVAVWAPERGVTIHYDIRGGALSGPRAMSTFHADHMPVVAVVAEPLPASLMDSDRAHARSQELGARAFQDRTGAGVAAYVLIVHRSRRVIWRVAYLRPRTQYQLHVYLDATTGELVDFEDHSLGPRRSPTP